MTQRFQFVNISDDNIPKLQQALSQIGHASGTLGVDGGPISGTSCQTTSGGVVAGPGSSGGAVGLKGDYNCADSD